MVAIAFERYYDLVLAALLVMLSSPAQRLEPRPMVALLAAAMAVRSLGRLLLGDPVRVYGCAECAPNPFALWPDRTAFETVEIASNVAVATLVVIVGLAVLRRLVRAGPVLRRVRWPILVAGGLAMGAAAYNAFGYCGLARSPNEQGLGGPDRGRTAFQRPAPARDSDTNRRAREVGACGSAIGV